VEGERQERGAKRRRATQRDEGWVRTLCRRRRIIINIHLLRRSHRFPRALVKFEQGEKATGTGRDGTAGPSLDCLIHPAHSVLLRGPGAHGSRDTADEVLKSLGTRGDDTTIAPTLDHNR
jgi:hypothetical protein